MSLLEANPSTHVGDLKVSEHVEKLTDWRLRGAEAIGKAASRVRARKAGISTLVEQTTSALIQMGESARAQHMAMETIPTVPDRQLTQI